MPTWRRTGSSRDGAPAARHPHPRGAGRVRGGAPLAADRRWPTRRDGPAGESCWGGWWRRWASRSTPASPSLTRLAPSAGAGGRGGSGEGSDRLRRGPAACAEAIAAVARAQSPEGPSGWSRAATSRRPTALWWRRDGVGERLATMIVMRALYLARDAFPASDPALQRAAGAPNSRGTAGAGGALAAVAGVRGAAPVAARRGGDELSSATLPPYQGHRQVAHDLQARPAHLVYGIVLGVPVSGIVEVHHVDRADAGLLQLEVVVDQGCVSACPRRSSRSPGPARCSRPGSRPRARR